MELPSEAFFDVNKRVSRSYRGITGIINIEILLSITCFGHE